MPQTPAPGRFLAITLLFFTTVAGAAWERIEVDADLLEDLFGSEQTGSDDDGRPLFIDDDGTERIPGCAETPLPVLNEDDLPVLGDNGFPLVHRPTPEEARFAFFVDLGDAPPKKKPKARDLLIHFAGGGACWDAATCVDAWFGPLPIYSPFLTEDEVLLSLASADALDEAGAGGILTSGDARPENPFGGFAKVHIPYCTGDIHVGSSDTTYTSTLPFVGSATIRHRGFDNLLVVLKWLQREQQRKNGPLSAIGKLTLAGSSAGAYAVPINFPVIRAALGEGPDYSIVLDSGNGVLTNGFLDKAFGPPGEEGVWGAKQNLAGPVADILDQEAADTLWRSVLATVASTYPDTRISQSTSAYDAVQALIYVLMKQSDQGTYNPLVPPTEAEVALTALLDWSPKARGGMIATAFTVPNNYRYYLAAGDGHIHLTSLPSPFEYRTPNYFAEDSAGGVPYTGWLDDMLNNPRLYFGTDWRNLSCFPGCLQL